jgi:hypothetical protein
MYTCTTVPHKYVQLCQWKAKLKKREQGRGSKKEGMWVNTREVKDIASAQWLDEFFHSLWGCMSGRQGGGTISHIIKTEEDTHDFSFNITE